MVSKKLPSLTYGRNVHYQVKMEETPIKLMIGLWPTRRSLAEEIGVKTSLVHKWAEAGRVPSKYQAAVVHAAQRRGFHDVTAEWMVRVHSDLPPNENLVPAAPGIPRPLNPAGQ